ncbi:hypothetical protein JCM24511_06509 [Saitozyma sp. JCM 24511]|nr:hypothetical protein JCM24511_06509 [Saitozyma sp. JCM 24511]
MPFGASHKPLVLLAHSAITSFFRSIEVFGSENVPTEGPIIFNTIPHGHLLHYWVKDSLFKNPAVGAMLYNAGNIAVDRKNKDNQKLFRGTFEALALGESIGVFPEGTSHTEPHMIPLKDGTSWAALEYIRYLLGTEENKGAKKGKRAVVVPVGLAYVDKAKYRSRVVVYYGEPITMDEYAEQFLSEEEGASRIAVKRLTRRIDLEMWKHTVNAPDWDTAFAAQMARELLWEKESDLALANFVEVSQSLADLFSTTSNESISSLKSLLVTYRQLLVSSRLSNASLTDIPLPQTLDPNAKVSLPNRFSTLWLLIKDSLAAFIRLPVFFVPLIFHLPVYFVGTLGARLVEDELETQAQMKIAFGLLLSFLTYPVMFFTFWAVFRQLPLGAAIAAGVVWLLGRYHAALIDENYEGMKRLVAAWRLLIGVWTPRRFEYSLSSFLASSNNYAPNPPKIAGLPPQTPPEKYTKPKRLPSRVLVRHVLRTRVEAARQLARVLFELEDKDPQVSASFWLATKYGGEVDREREALDQWDEPFPRGVRSGREVVGFLRSKGARLGGAKDAGHWAASSGAETELTEAEE